MRVCQNVTCSFPRRGASYILTHPLPCGRVTTYGIILFATLTNPQNIPDSPGDILLCHPMSARRCCSSLFRSLFLLIFAIQNSRLVLGSLQHLVLSILSISTWCPCQKHPFTKIHVRYLRNPKSGWPGNRWWFNQNLKPLFHNPRRTIISGFVSFDLTAAILLL